MQNIKIYLATADDLELEYNEILKLVKELNKIFNPRQVNLELVPHNKNKSEIKSCELSLALYYAKFGDYSQEDFRNAYNSLCDGNNPKKIYVFFKDADSITADLQNFKENFVTNFGHFFCKFENIDTLKLNFLMQVESFQNNYRHENLINFKGHKVYFDTYEVVDLDNIPFASLNVDYTRMRDDLVNYSKEIEELRLKIVQYPDDEDFQNDLQEALNARNKLEEEFQQHQEALFNTALRIAKISHERMSDRLQRGINAFTLGNASEANAILSEAEIDADNFLQNYREHRALLEEEREKIELSIEELLLKAEVVLADTKFTIEERIEQTKNTYIKAKEVALEIELDMNKLDLLLFNYAGFLHKYAFYDEAIEIYNEQIILSEEIYGTEHSNTATSYNNIGGVYSSKGDYNKALEYYSKALVIREKSLSMEDKMIAMSYNNLGTVYYSHGDCDKASVYFNKALAIQEKNLGVEHIDTATSYNNVGGVYSSKGDYDKALEYFSKALVIVEKVLGMEHYMTATSYNNVGSVYYSINDYNKALEYYNTALEVLEKILGIKHSDTALSYKNIGGAYYSLGEFGKALEFYNKALPILEKVLGMEHTDTVSIYNKIGKLYERQENYAKALEYYHKFLAIQERTLGSEHADITKNYYSIGSVYRKQGDYDKVLEYYHKALAIWEKILGLEHIDTAQGYNNIGTMYYEQNDYTKALEYYHKALAIWEKVLGLEHTDTAQGYSNIGTVSDSQGDYDNALKYYYKALMIQKKVLGLENLDIVNSYINISATYRHQKNDLKALEYYYKALSIEEKILGLEHPEIAMKYSNIGLMYKHQGDYAKALEYNYKALAIQEKVLGLEHFNTKDTLYIIEKIQEAQKQAKTSTGKIENNTSKFFMFSFIWHIFFFAIGSFTAIEAIIDQKSTYWEILVFFWGLSSVPFLLSSGFLSEFKNAKTKKSKNSNKSIEDFAINLIVSIIIFVFKVFLSFIIGAISSPFILIKNIIELVAYKKI